MFKTARLRLTFWYLVIIMMVSVIFSLAIYQILVREVERFARQHVIRTQIQVFNGAPPRLFFNDDALPQVELELVKDSKTHILVNLFIVNGIILVFSGGLAYFLAGKTLQPIQEMVDEQHRFVSDASHELRTPLTALKTSMEVSLRDKKLDLPGAKKIIHESVQDVNRLQELSENLLQLTQYQKQNGNTHFEQLALGGILREAVKKIEPLAKKKKIEVAYDPTPLVLEGNKYGLVDLLVILLDNAVKYNHQNGKVTIGSKKQDKYVLLTVTDTGIGIRKKDIPYIFDRFYRADMARTKAAAGGYGLGLSIAKKIVELHHGRIQVESALDKGTTFEITLPMKHT